MISSSFDRRVATLAAPSQASCATNGVGSGSSAAALETPRARDDHDDEDEQRLCGVSGLGVSQRVFAASGQRYGQHQYEGPEAEDDFNLSQEMQEACVARVSKRVRQAHTRDEGQRREHRYASARLVDAAQALRAVLLTAASAETGLANEVEAVNQ